MLMMHRIRSASTQHYLCPGGQHNLVFYFKCVKNVGQWAYVDVSRGKRQHAFEVAVKLRAYLKLVIESIQN